MELDSVLNLMQDPVPYIYYDWLALEDIVPDEAESADAENTTELSSMESSSDLLSHVHGIPLIEDIEKEV